MADIPPSNVGNDMCSTRQTLALFRGHPCRDCRETGRSMYGPFPVLQSHLVLKMKVNFRSRPVATVHGSFPASNWKRGSGIKGVFHVSF